MKHVVLSLMLGLLLVPSFVTAQTDRERDGLRGPVRTIVTEKVSGVSPHTPRRDTSLHDHVQLASWQPDQSPPPASHPEWQQQPRTLWRTMAYDMHGKRTDAAFYTDDGALRWRWQYTYNTQGNRMTRTSYDATGLLRWAWHYRYDAQGHIAEQTECDTTGELVRRWTFRYDTHDNIIEETNYNSDGSMVWQWRFTYDAAGKLRDKAQYAAHNVLVRTWRYLYDAAGRLSEERTEGAFGTVLWIRQYAYDERDNLREETRYKGDGTLQGKWRHTYTYDAMGNWVRRTTASWAMLDAAFVEPFEVTYRALTYYQER